MNGNRLVTRRRVLQGAGAAVGGVDRAAGAYWGARGRFRPARRWGALMGCGGRGGGDVRRGRAVLRRRETRRSCSSRRVMWNGWGRPTTDAIHGFPVGAGSGRTSTWWRSRRRRTRHAPDLDRGRGVGKDVLCEKPMTRTIGRRAVVTRRAVQPHFPGGDISGATATEPEQGQYPGPRIMRSGLLKVRACTFPSRRAEGEGIDGKTDQPTREPPDVDVACTSAHRR